METDRPVFEPVFLDEAHQTLHAIRRGAVDAFVVEEPDGDRVYALGNADLPYSVMVERMQQGAAMLNESGEFLSCNPSLAALVGVAREEVIGKTLADFLAEPDWRICRQLLHNVTTRQGEHEATLRRSDGSEVAAKLSFLVLTADKSANGLLVTDLTAEEQREEFSAALQRMQDEERRSISRELHDSVGQLLAAISMNLGAIVKESDKVSPATARAAQDSVALVEAISKEIRTISYLLHPPLLEMAGLAAAVRWYVDGFSERSKIPVELEISPDLPSLSDEVDVAVYRVVQECLTNVHRHSGSNWCSLRLTHGQGRLQIEIRDSGCGIPKDKLARLGSGSAGVGLRGMRERLRQLGGALELQSDGKGTTVTAWLPLPSAGAGQDKGV